MNKLHEERLRRIEEAKKIMAEADFMEQYDGAYHIARKMKISVATARSYLKQIRP